MSIQLSHSTWESLFEEYNQALQAGPEVTTLDQQRAVGNADELAHYVSRVAPFDGEKVTHYGLPWYPVDDDTPYASLEELSDAWYGVGAFHQDIELKVSDCWHDHPVFTRSVNLSFRVWHDTDHIRSQHGFDRDAEVELFVWQAREFPRTVSGQRYVEALFCESVYQLSAAVVLGTYPDHQAVRTPGPVGRALLDAWGF